MPFDLVKDDAADPTANARVWAGTVTLSSGTATVAFSDLPGVAADLDSEPRIIATPKGDDAVFVSSAGTSQATLSDGSGSSSNVVNVAIYEVA